MLGGTVLWSDTAWQQVCLLVAQGQATSVVLVQQSPGKEGGTTLWHHLGPPSTFCRASGQLAGNSQASLFLQGFREEIRQQLHFLHIAWLCNSLENNCEAALGVKLRDKACKPQTAIKAVPLIGFQLPTASLHWINLTGSSKSRTTSSMGSHRQRVLKKRVGIKLLHSKRQIHPKSDKMCRASVVLAHSLICVGSRVGTHMKKWTCGNGSLV